MACQTPYRSDTAQVLLYKIASCIEASGGGIVAGVSSFNGRIGAVTLTAADVSTALGCTPLCVADGDARYVLKTGDTMTGALTIGNGVLVANDPVLELSQTWNNAAVAFTALLSNVTATAAAAGSQLFDFQQGGVSVLNLRTDGRLTLTGRIAATTTSSIGHSVNTLDALNTAVVNVLTIGHTLSAGVGAAGLGARIDMVGDSATVVSQSQLRIDSSWVDPVQATRTSKVDFVLPVSGTFTTILTLTGNQAQFRDGTAALPALTFQTDTDTGIYRIGANNFGLSAGGALIFDVATDGVNLTTALAYQYNAVNVIRAQTALNNYFFGPSGNLTMTGTNNSAIGSLAFLANTTGASNTAIGALALQNNTTGTSNSAIGVNALNANTTGGFNSAVGAIALLSNTTGTNNCAIGVSALQANTTGNNNSAIGVNSLLANTTGTSNAAIGTSTLSSNTTGASNAAIGTLALQSNTTGNSNSVVGVTALQNNTTGTSNSAIGVNALFNNTTGSQNTAIGFNTGLGITTGGDNTIIGANVTGLAAALASNIILATGAGVIRLQIDSSGNTTLAGTLATGDGTAALPAKTFSADLNTGLYRIGADSIGTSTGGTLRTTTNTTDVILATAFRLAMASGANQRAGNAVLVGGTVTVANTSVTANTVVLLTRKTAGGTIGTSITYTVIAATSFTITSDSVIDTSTFSYCLIEVP